MGPREVRTDRLRHRQGPGVDQDLQRAAGAGLIASLRSFSPITLRLLTVASLALLVGLGAFLFRKSDHDAACEVLRNISRPEDIVVISDGQEACSPSIPAARKTVLADRFRIMSKPDYRDLELRKGSRTWHEESANPSGRIIVLSHGAAPVNIIGRTIRVPLGNLLLAVVYPMESSEGRWDLMAYFPEASVRREGTEGRRPCPLKGNVFSCGGEPWMDVSVMSLPFAGAFQSCIFAHPVTDGTLVIEYTAPTDTGSILLAGGIDDMGVGYPEGTPVAVVLSTGSRELGSTIFTNDPGYFFKKVILSETVPAGSHLAIRITSKNQDTRHFCFRGIGVK